MRFITCLFLVSSLTACGSGSSDSGKETSPAAQPEQTLSERQKAVGALYVATAAAMPACDEASNDRIVYVADEKVLKACLAGAWTPVDLNQPEPVIVTETHLCAASADLDPSNDVTTDGKSMHVTKFSNGEYFVSCMDRKSDATYTYSDSTTCTAHYSAKSTGVLNDRVGCVAFYAKCEFNPSTGNGSWTLNGSDAKTAVSCSVP